MRVTITPEKAQELLSNNPKNGEEVLARALHSDPQPKRWLQFKRPRGRSQCWG